MFRGSHRYKGILIVLPQDTQNSGSFPMGPCWFLSIVSSATGQKHHTLPSSRRKEHQKQLSLLIPRGAHTVSQYHSLPGLRVTGSPLANMKHSCCCSQLISPHFQVHWSDPCTLGVTLPLHRKMVQDSCRTRAQPSLPAQWGSWFPWILLPAAWPLFPTEVPLPRSACSESTSLDTPR